MIVNLPITLVKKVLEEIPNENLNRLASDMGYRRHIPIDLGKIPLDLLKALYKETKDDDKKDYANRIRFMYSALRSKKNLKAHNMQELAIALRAFLSKDRIKGYLFQQGERDAVAPFLVTNVTLDPVLTYRGTHPINMVTLRYAYATRDQGDITDSIKITPVNIVALAQENGIEIEEKEVKETKERSGYIYDFECKDGIDVEDVLSRHGLYKETKELHELYDAQIERFFKCVRMYGKQFRVLGEAFDSDYWTNYSTSMLFEGKPARCIMNTIPQVCIATDGDDEKSSRRSRSRRRWRNDEDDESTDVSDIEDLEISLEDVTLSDLQGLVEVNLDNEEGGEEKNMREAPLHPTVQIFHLEKHEFFTVHVVNLAPYKYKDNISDNLILEDDVKTLVHMLVQSDDESEAEDVIEGKSQSTVIVCIGSPGVGKTLTAEVIAEATKKPLYKIPADQLGGSAESLEHNLNRILRRAERWDCVLMIDEANAYVHARGADIKQNAVVGVFLRKLEYFRGILFLTTNQTTEDGNFDIDDAILSRASAVLRLDLPDKVRAARIWKVQAKMLGVKIGDDLVNKLVETYHLSGRSIRQLLRLTNRWASHNGDTLKFEHFKTCAKFIPFSADEKERTKQ